MKWKPGDPWACGVPGMDLLPGMCSRIAGCIRSRRGKSVEIASLSDPRI